MKKIDEASTVGTAEIRYDPRLADLQPGDVISWPMAHSEIFIQQDRPGQCQTDIPDTWLAVVLDHKVYEDTRRPAKVGLSEYAHRNEDLEGHHRSDVFWDPASEQLIDEVSRRPLTDSICDVMVQIGARTDLVSNPVRHVRGRL